MLAVPVILCLVSAAPSLALDNGLGRTPQMGWNSWNHFACNISSKLIQKTADLLVSTGLAKAGYTYLNLDDCWAKGRDDKGKIYPDPEAFPEGMAALGKYIHDKGLKYGVYSDAGNLTCAKRPGSLGFEYADAASYAEWQVDYLKYDNCYNEDIEVHLRYPIMRDALNKTGHPIFFSMCEWGIEKPWEWAKSVGNSWRTTGDIDNTWKRIMYILDLNAPLAPYAGPGGWNDPDMLEVGNGLSDVEARSHFSLWAMMKAPLLIGCDLQDMSEATKTILMNEEVIAINQDPVGMQGIRLETVSDVELWVAHPLSDGGAAVISFNRGSTHKHMQLEWHDPVLVRDLWAHTDLGVGHNFTFLIPPHGAVMLRSNGTTLAAPPRMTNLPL